MIHTVLAALVGELNFHLQRHNPNADGELARLANLIDATGKPAIENDEQIICHLVNVEQDRSVLNTKPRRTYNTNPPTNLNLYVLFASFSNRHQNALKQLSSTIEFFQGKQVFTRENTPGLPNETEKIMVEFHYLDLQQLNNLWGIIGANAIPAVMYKIRVHSTSGPAILEEVTEISTSTKQL
jgi:hypothetical protein